MKKRRRLKKPFRIALEVLAYIAIVVGMVAAFMCAVLQESYKLYPPTDAEIAENHALASYK